MLGLLWPPLWPPNTPASFFLQEHLPRSPCHLLGSVSRSCLDLPQVGPTLVTSTISEWHRASPPAPRGGLRDRTLLGGENLAWYKAQNDREVGTPLGAHIPGPPHPGADTVPLHKVLNVRLHVALSCGQLPSPLNFLNTVIGRGLAEPPGHTEGEPAASPGQTRLSGVCGTAVSPASHLPKIRRGSSFQWRDPGPWPPRRCCGPVPCPLCAQLPEVRSHLETCVSGSPAPCFPNEVPHG